MYQDQVPSLFEHYHKFTVEDVIAHHKFRCDEPDPEIDLIINLETEESIQLCFELDACNASVQRDLVGVQTKFSVLALGSVPGENVTELATEARQLMHILSGSYALPLDLGTKLIKK